MTTITIDISSLIDDLKIRSFVSTQNLPAAEAYAFRIGEENTDAWKQSLQEAWRSLLVICRKFLAATSDTVGDDGMETLSGDFTLSFDLSARRVSNIGDSLAQAIHSYLVGSTLRRFYTDAVYNLAQSYADMENRAQAEILTLLHTKSEPIYI